MGVKGGQQSTVRAFCCCLRQREALENSKKACVTSSGAGLFTLFPHEIGTFCRVSIEGGLSFGSECALTTLLAKTLYPTSQSERSFTKQNSKSHSDCTGQLAGRTGAFLLKHTALNRTLSRNELRPNPPTPMRDRGTRPRSTLSVPL
jgi:hypothetical protein